MTGLDLDWPFFDTRHRQLARELETWAAANLIASHSDDVEAEVRALVAKLGAAGFLGLTIADGALDVRSLAIARATLAYHSGLADFAFAMQGLGSGAISLFGTARQRAQYLSQVASGQSIAAFAMTEPATGSDAANISTTATRDGDDYVINGEKTYISNGRSPTSSPCSRGPAKPTARAEFRPSSCPAAPRVSRSPSGSTLSPPTRSPGSR